MAQEYVFTKHNPGQAYCPGNISIDNEHGTCKVRARRTTTWDIENMLNYRTAAGRDAAGLVSMPSVAESLLEHTIVSYSPDKIRKILKCYRGPAWAVLFRTLVLHCDITQQTGLMMHVSRLLRAKDVVRASKVIGRSEKNMAGWCACVSLVTSPDVPSLPECVLPRYLERVTGINTRIDELLQKEAAIMGSSGKDRPERQLAVREKMRQEYDNMGPGYSYISKDSFGGTQAPLMHPTSLTQFTVTHLSSPVPNNSWSASFFAFIAIVRDAICSDGGCETPAYAHALISALCDPIACSTLKSSDKAVRPELCRILDSMFVKLREVASTPFKKACVKNMDLLYDLVKIPEQVPWHPIISVLAHMLQELEGCDLTYRTLENITMCQLHIFLIIGALNYITGPKDVGLLLYSAFTKLQLPLPENSLPSCFLDDDDGEDREDKDKDKEDKDKDKEDKEDNDAEFLLDFKVDTTNPILAFTASPWAAAAFPPSYLHLNSEVVYNCTADEYAVGKARHVVYAASNIIFHEQLTTPHKNMGKLLDWEVLACVTWDPAAAFATHHLNNYIEDSSPIKIYWNHMMPGELFRTMGGLSRDQDKDKNKDKDVIFHVRVPRVQNRETVLEYDETLLRELTRLRIYGEAERAKQRVCADEITKKHGTDGYFWATDVDRTGDDSLVDRYETSLLDQNMDDTEVESKMLERDTAMSGDEVESGGSSTRKRPRPEEPLYVEQILGLHKYKGIKEFTRSQMLAILKLHKVTNKSPEELGEMEDSIISSCFWHALGRIPNEKYKRSTK